jgi:hypothetical protein
MISPVRLLFAQGKMNFFLGWEGKEMVKGENRNTVIKGLINTQI